MLNSTQKAEIQRAILTQREILGQGMPAEKAALLCAVRIWLILRLAVYMLSIGPLSISGARYDGELLEILIVAAIRIAIVCIFRVQFLKGCRWIPILLMVADAVSVLTSVQTMLTVFSVTELAAAAITALDGFFVFRIYQNSYAKAIHAAKIEIKARYKRMGVL